MRVMNVGELRQNLKNYDYEEFDTLYRYHFLDIEDKESAMRELLNNLKLITDYKENVRKFLNDLIDNDWLHNFSEMVKTFLLTY